MEYKIDVIGEEDEVGNILPHETIVLVAREVADVFGIARNEVVESNDSMPLREKAVRKVRTQKARSTGDYGDGTVRGSREHLCKLFVTAASEQSVTSQFLLRKLLGSGVTVDTPNQTVVS